LPPSPLSLGGQLKANGFCSAIKRGPKPADADSDADADAKSAKSLPHGQCGAPIKIPSPLLEKHKYSH